MVILVCGSHTLFLWTLTICRSKSYRKRSRIAISWSLFPQVSPNLLFLHLDSHASCCCLSLWYMTSCLSFDQRLPQQLFQKNETHWDRDWKLFTSFASITWITPSTCDPRVDRFVRRPSSENYYYLYSKDRTPEKHDDSYEATLRKSIFLFSTFYFLNSFRYGQFHISLVTDMIHTRRSFKFHREDSSHWFPFLGSFTDRETDKNAFGVNHTVSLEHRNREGRQEMRQLLHRT